MLNIWTFPKHSTFWAVFVHIGINILYNIFLSFGLFSDLNSCYFSLSFPSYLPKKFILLLQIYVFFLEVVELCN
jgi:hypothetical protein